MTLQELILDEQIEAIRRRNATFAAPVLASAGEPRVRHRAALRGVLARALVRVGLLLDRDAIEQTTSRGTNPQEARHAL